MRLLRESGALLCLTLLIACGGGAPSAIPATVSSGSNAAACLTPAAIHQGRNTLLLEGDALSIRAFAPGFTSATPPVFSFPFVVPGADANPHPYDLASDSSGRLYADIFDDLLSGVAIYNRIPTCAAANVLPDAVLSGPHTGLGSVYSLAIDRMDRIYVANIVGTESQISIFAANAAGDVPPIATIRGPRTLLGSQAAGNPGFTKSVRVDSNFNVYTSNSIGQITIFAAGSSGDVAPSRIIAGDKTLLVDPRIALGPDASIYAANFEGNSVTVYAPGANGNVSPVRTLAGSQTAITLPESVAVCADGTTYVAALRGVMTFAPRSDGNAAPLRMVLGGQSGVFQAIALGF